MTRQNIKLPLSNENIAFMLLSGVGASLILLCTAQYGAGLWPDAVKYIATARSLVHGEGFVFHHATPGPLVDWAPLYPMLLAAISKVFHVDPFNVANIVNALLFGLIIYTTCIIARKQLLLSPKFVYLTAIFVVCSKSIFEISTYASSEPLFIFLSLIAILQTETYCIKRDLFSLSIFSAAIGLSTLTRYIGISLIPFGLIVIAFSRRGLLENKFFHFLIFGILSIVPICVWFIRNMIVSDTLMGARSPSQYSLLQNIYYTIVTIIGWHLPNNHIISIIILLIVSIFIITFGLNNYQKFRLNDVYQYLNTNYILIAFVIFYSTFILISSTTTAYDSINGRLLSPIYIPLILLILVAVEQMVSSLNQSSIIILISIIIIALFDPARIMVNTIQRDVTQGVNGYSDKEWKISQTIKYLMNNISDKNSAIFSNEPDAIYYLVHLNAKWSPSRYAYMSPQKSYDIQKLKGIWPADSTAYLVWFNINKRQYLFYPHELMTISKMVPVIKLADSVIYLISKSNQDDSESGFSPNIARIVTAASPPHAFMPGQNCSRHVPMNFGSGISPNSKDRPNESITTSIRSSTSTAGTSSAGWSPAGNRRPWHKSLLQIGNYSRFAYRPCR